MLLSTNQTKIMRVFDQIVDGATLRIQDIAKEARLSLDCVSSELADLEAAGIVEHISDEPRLYYATVFLRDLDQD